MLIHRGKGHNKFWNAKKYPSQNGIDVEVTYGRLGTNGQSQVKSFTNEYAANMFIGKKKSEKIRKGYQEVSDRDFEVLVIQSEILGTANKLSDFDWLEQLDNGGFAPASNTRLSDPDCTPALKAKIETRKFGNIEMLFTANDIYCKSEINGSFLKIDEKDKRYAFATKVHDALTVVL